MGIGGCEINVDGVFTLAWSAGGADGPWDGGWTTIIDGRNANRPD
jgi:hypothetical protein